LRFLVRFAPSEASRGVFLESARALAKSVGVEARNPKWTSYGALEVDIFCPSSADLEIFVAIAQPLAKPEFITDLNRAPEHMTDDEILSKARGLFNAERYWECHEVLEGLWRQKQGEEKRLLQGIILVCAAFIHHQKGEDAVALSVLRRGANQLDFPRTKYGGFDVPNVKKEVQRMLTLRRFKDFRV
jgi:uncharacterized protein